MFSVRRPREVCPYVSQRIPFTNSEADARQCEPQYIRYPDACQRDEALQLYRQLCPTSTHWRACALNFNVSNVNHGTSESACLPALFFWYRSRKYGRFDCTATISFKHIWQHRQEKLCANRIRHSWSCGAYGRERAAPKQHIQQPPIICYGSPAEHQTILLCNSAAAGHTTSRSAPLEGCVGARQNGR